MSQTRPESTAVGFSTAKDGYGDRLPVGAVQRLGTARLAHPTEIAALAWGDHDRVLISADRTGGVRTWDGHSGRRLFRLRNARGTVLAVSPDGSLAALANPDLSVWVLATGALRWRVAGAGRQVGSLAFSPNGKRLAVGNGSAVDVLDAANGVPVAHFEGLQDSVDQVAWSGDGSRIASADAAGLVLVRDATTGKLRTTFHLAEGATPVQVLRFTPNGRWLLAGNEPVEVRDAKTGEFLRDLKGRGPIEGATLLGDGRTLLTSPTGSSHALIAWDLASGASRPAWTDGGAAPTELAMDPGGDRVAVADALGRITLRRPTDGRRVDVHVGHEGGINAVVFSTDGREAWSAGADGQVFAWDVGSGAGHALPDPHPGGVLSLALSKDGKRLLSGGWDGVVRERRADNGWTIRSLDAGAPVTVGYRHDGAPVTWSGPKGLLVWTHAGPRTLSPADQGPMAIDASGRHAVVPRSAHLVVIDLDSGTVSGRLPGLPVPVASLQDAAWSPDGTHIALAGSEGRIWVVPAGGAGSTRLLTGPPGLVTAVAWSPDGKRLASSHRDGARIWDAATGRLLGHVHGHDDYATDVEWIPGGSRIATASADGTTLVWTVP